MGNKKTSKEGASIRYANHIHTTTCTEVFQINLLSFASRRMLICTLSPGPNSALPMGLDMTKSGVDHKPPNVRC